MIVSDAALMPVPDKSIDENAIVLESLTFNRNGIHSVRLKDVSPFALQEKKTKNIVKTPDKLFDVSISDLNKI